MRAATILFLACSASSVLAGPVAEAERSHGSHVQFLAIDVSGLRHEFYDVGWRSSFYVHLDDTYATFVTTQLNRLSEGKYIDLLPEIRSQAGALDHEASFDFGCDERGGWRLSECRDAADEEGLIVLTRQIRSD